MSGIPTVAEAAIGDRLCRAPGGDGAVFGACLPHRKALRRRQVVGGGHRFHDTVITVPIDPPKTYIRNRNYLLASPETSWFARSNSSSLASIHVPIPSPR